MKEEALVVEEESQGAGALHGGLAPIAGNAPPPVCSRPDNWHSKCSVLNR